MLACSYPEAEWVQRFAVELCTLQHRVSWADATAKGFDLWPRYGIFIPEPVAHWLAHDEAEPERR